MRTKILLGNRDLKVSIQKRGNLLINVYLWNTLGSYQTSTSQTLVMSHLAVRKLLSLERGLLEVSQDLLSKQFQQNQKFTILAMMI